MDECTEPGSGSTAGVILYGVYFLWADYYGKNKVPLNQWAKDLKKLGYENYRENEPGSNCNKKIAHWIDVRIRRGVQDRLIPKNNDQACPVYTKPMANEKTDLRQAGQAFLPSQTLYDNNAHPLSLKYNEVKEDKPSQKTPISENLLTRKNQACPKMLFLDSERHRTGSHNKLVNIPVLGLKVINYEQPNEDNILKKSEDIKAFRTDLKNLVRSEYNGVVESIPDLLNDFNRRYPGYHRVLGDQDLQNEAEKLNSWGWMS
jgi:putative DNA primase/helicase